MIKYLLAYAAALLSVTTAEATTYFSNRVIGGEKVHLEITTDGTVGVLSSENILDFFITNRQSVLKPNGYQTGSFISGNSLTATAGNLTFNFGSAGSDMASFYDVGNGLLYNLSANQYTDGGFESFLNNFNDVDVSSRFSGKEVFASIYLPEPATWFLMIAGFSLVGVAIRTTARTSLART